MRNSLLICLVLFVGILFFNSNEKTELEKHVDFVENYEVKPLFETNGIELAKIVTQLPLTPINSYNVISHSTNE